MSTPDDIRNEQPGTYIVQDRANVQELERLTLQDAMITASMGGVLPEQDEPELFRYVLDIGCGTGGWLLELANTYRQPGTLIGIDVNKRLLDYARAQVEAHPVDRRIEFLVMDALRMLEFPDSYFDLVNLRFGLSFLRTWDWPKLLQECRRVVKPGGVVRVTDSRTISHSNSPAHMRLRELGVQAFYHAGHAFSPDARGVSREISRLMQQQQLEQVQMHLYEREYRAGTTQGELFCEDIRQLFRNVQPFLRKWTRVPDNYEEIYQQMLYEMQQPDFVARWDLVTIWASRPL